jgi:hypothetical protein
MAFMQAIMPQPAIADLFQLKNKLKRHLHEPPRKRCIRKWSPYFSAYGQQRGDDLGNRSAIFHKLTHPPGEVQPAGLPDPDAEHLERTPDDILDVAAAVDQGTARHQQQPQLLASGALDVHLPEPARAHHLRDAARIVAIGLVAHRSQRRLHVPRFDADHWQAQLAQPLMQP